MVAGGTWKDPGALKGTPLYGFGFYFAERITKERRRFLLIGPLGHGDVHSICLR